MLVNKELTYFYNGCCFTGNKRDLENLREVNFSDAQSFAQQHNMISHLETSAKENCNIEETFVKLAKVVLSLSQG